MILALLALAFVVGVWPYHLLAGDDEHPRASAARATTVSAPARLSHPEAVQRLDAICASTNREIAVVRSRADAGGLTVAGAIGAALPIYRAALAQVERVQPARYRWVYAHLLAAWRRQAHAVRGLLPDPTNTEAQLAVERAHVSLRLWAQTFGLRRCGR
jgi:hypothetical protein